MKERLGIEANMEPTRQSGQFDVVVDGAVVASRGGNPVTRILFGAGFPDTDELVAGLERLQS
jgi:hypothetical protein